MKKLFALLALLVVSFTFQSCGSAKKTQKTQTSVSKKASKIKSKSYKKNAIASYYHDKFNGRKTASGSIFNNKNYTAAHKTLPFGTKVRVTNLKNSKEIIVEINDRGPFIKGRQLDLSKKAFMDLAQNKNNGVLNVKIEVLPEDYQEKKVELQEELNTIAAIPTDLDLNEFAL